MGLAKFKHSPTGRTELEQLFLFGNHSQIYFENTVDHHYVQLTRQNQPTNQPTNDPTNPTTLSHKISKCEEVQPSSVFPRWLYGTFFEIKFFPETTVLLVS